MQIDYCIRAKHLFTADSMDEMQGLVLIAGDRIVDVIPGLDVSGYVDAHTKIIDAGDGLVMPGFVDAHTHFFSGALAASEHVCCEIEQSVSEEDCIRILKEYEAAHPNEKRIRGRGWFITNWKGGKLPTKRSLDEAFGEKPVYLMAADCHSYWLNSAALRECGVTEDTQVEMGYIGKFDNGELSGMLVEMDACNYAEKKYSEFDEEEQKEIDLAFMETAAGYGVTSLSEMIPGEYDDRHLGKYQIVQKLAGEGLAKTRLHLFTKLYDTPSFDRALEWKKKLDSPFLKLSGVKGFVDGVAETYTGLLLEPYTDRPDTCGIGVPAKPQEELSQAVIKANAAGLPVRIHCIADGSVRMALDAFEASVRVNGICPANTIEHIENIHPDDIPRFRELGVLPSMQPIHLLLDADGKITRIGEQRIRYEWPTKTLYEQTGRLALGTDYPVVDINPFDNLYAAVTRDNFDRTPASHNAWEKLTMPQALLGYTTYAAEAYSRSDELGKLKKGYLADVILLDRNLLTIDTDQIRNTQVMLTMLGGKIIYDRKNEV